MVHRERYGLTQLVDCFGRKDRSRSKRQWRELQVGSGQEKLQKVILDLEVETKGARREDRPAAEVSSPGRAHEASSGSSTTQR